LSRSTLYVVTHFLCITASCAGLAATQSRAETYPARPVRLIVPFAPGGGTDIIARALAPKATDAFAQPVVIDNRGGGGGTIGAELTVRATPDGYTLCLVSTSYATNAAIFKLPYNPITDIAPIALIGETGLLISLHPSVAARSVKELIAMAKARPDELNYASTGTGGNTHLVTELFNLKAGTRMTHVPYKGTGAAMSDLLGGQIQLIFGSLPSVLPLHRAGRLRGIGITSAKRNDAIPDIPAIAETVPGYAATVWYGLWGPKGLPAGIVSRWNTTVRRSLQLPDVKERLAGEGLAIADGPPHAFIDVVQRDVAKYREVVIAAKIDPVQ